MLTKEQIQAKEDRSIKTVYIKAWDDEIRIKSLSAELQLGLKAVMDTAGDNLLAPALSMIMASVINEDGSLMFNQDDMAMLSDKSGKALEEIVIAIMELNELSDSAVEAEAKK